MTFLLWPGLIPGAQDECPRLLTGRKVKPCSAIETNIYYIEELFPELDWRVETFPRGLSLHSNLGLSYEFRDLPTFSPDPLAAFDALLVRHAWIARMTISPQGRITTVRSPLEGLLGQELKGHLKSTLDKYLQRKIVTAAEVADFEAEEASLDPTRITYFTFTDLATKTDVSVGTTDAAIRIYDGSPYPGLVRQSLGLKVPPSANGHIVPPERKHTAVFKHLRKTLGENTILFDLGRLGVSKELDYGLPALLREIALSYCVFRFRYDFQAIDGAHFVMSATPVGAQLYHQRYGMHVLDPERLRAQDVIDLEQYDALKASPYRYLHMPVREFMDKFVNGARVY